MSHITVALLSHCPETCTVTVFRQILLTMVIVELLPPKLLSLRTLSEQKVASVFNQYFGQLYGQSNEHVNLPSILRPGTEDKVVILATCMNGETYYRYLILGVLVDDSAAS